jgi:hypothetical protein
MFLSKNQQVRLEMHFWDFFIFPSPGSGCLRQTSNKNAQFYINVCNLLTHNLHMHFKLVCKVHVCAPETQILCNARLHQQHPSVSGFFLNPKNQKPTLISHIHKAAEVMSSQAYRSSSAQALNFSKICPLHLQKSADAQCVCVRGMQVRFPFKDMMTLVSLWASIKDCHLWSTA